MDWEEEVPEALSAKENYKSAEEHADEILKTFEEERDMDMVEGPMSLEEAAARCHCRPDELVHGPMACIEELDKFRTIYDGSVGGQNDHIRKNTAEKTTAPAVHDCLHAVHCCRYLASNPPKSTNGWRPPDPGERYIILKAEELGHRAHDQGCNHGFGRIWLSRRQSVLSWWLRSCCRFGL